ncbi:MAG: hypothetical protein DRP75_04655, partial [Candidatus Omnitrophota bacterium]
RYLYPGLCKFLSHLSSHLPLCFLFDDIQYVDRESLEVVLALIREKKLPVLLIGGFSEQDLNDPELQESAFVKAIKGEEITSYSQTCSLRRLSAQGTQQMILHIFSQIPLPSDFFSMFYKITQGNPLFIEELLKYIIEKEYIFYQDGRWQMKEMREKDLPQTLEEVIKARVKDLSPEIREMIAKAAIIGDNFEVDILHKIDSEDRGYVLDVIEAAKRIGLVYESKDLGTDAYSFVTSQIRKVLLGILDDTRKRALYSRLGEIKERIFQDRISSIAGELYYNFKKAESAVRAEQYAKLLKEGRSAFYEHLTGYAQSILEEKKEKAKPLSKGALRLIPQILRYIYISALNYILYPAQSEMRKEPVEQLHKRLSEVLEECFLLNIRHIEDMMFINDKKIGKEVRGFFVNSVISLLKNLEIEGVTFRKGLRLEELFAFVEIISRREEREERISELLQRRGIRNIWVNEIAHDTQRKKSKERESLEEIMLIDYLLGRFSPEKGRKEFSPPARAKEVARVLERLGDQKSEDYGKDKEKTKAEIVFRSLEKASKQVLEKDAQGWERYKKGLAKIILSMDPDLQADILSRDTKEDTSEGKIDVIKELGSEIPDKTIVEVLTRQYLQEKADLQRIKKLMNKFLSSAEKKERLIPLLRERFKQIGASEDECRYLFSEKEEFSFNEKVEKILTLPTKTFLKLLPALQVEKVIEGLLSRNQEKKAEAILARLFKPLEEGFPGAQVLEKSFKEILAVLVESSPTLLSQFIEHLLKIDPAKVKSGFLPSILTPSLEKVVKILVEGGHLSQIKGLIEVYTQEKESMEGLSGTFESIAKAMVAETIRRIEINAEWAELAQSLILLAKYSAKPLVEEAIGEHRVPKQGYFEAYLRRFTLARVLKQMPRESFPLIREKIRDSRPFIVCNLIELIRAIGEEELISTLEIPLKQGSVDIRKKVVFTLAKMRSKESIRLLEEARKDENEEIRKQAEEALRLIK